MYENIHFEKLTQTATTVIGQSITPFSKTGLEVTIGKIRIMPGASTGLHSHDETILAAIVDDGELFMEYWMEDENGKEFKVEKVLRRGDSFVEAISLVHNGENRGDVPVLLTVVFINAVGTKATTPYEGTKLP